MHEIEVWKAIAGYEGAYMISTLGRVLSLPRVGVRSNGRSNPVPGRILTPSANPSGHLTISLCRDGAVRHAYVHRLVLETFEFWPCPPGWETRHINDIKTDNRWSNLYWGTSSDNEHDKVRNGKHNEASTPPRRVLASMVSPICTPKPLSRRSLSAK